MLGPVDAYGPRVRLVYPGQALYERRLAGAVVAQQCRHPPPVKIERDAVQGLHGAERLRQVPDLEGGSGHPSLAGMASPRVFQTPATAGAAVRAPVTPTTQARVTKA